MAAMNEPSRSLLPPLASCAVLLAPMVWTPPTHAARAGSYFSHHDWELACDNTGTCRAAGYQSDDDDLAMSLLLTRAAGPATPVSGEVKFGFYDDEPFAAGVDPAVTLTVAGA